MGKKLLVADDSVTIQKVIRLALSSEGYEILAVSTGKDAVGAIEEERPDVVLIDIALPDVDAYGVKRAVNQKPHLAHVGFILMASAFERVDERAANEVQFQGRLIKPFDPGHLRKTIAQVLQRAPEASQSAPQIETHEISVSQEPVFASPPSIAETPTIIAQDPEPTSEVENFISDLPPMQDMHPIVEEEDEEKQEAATAEALENDIRDLTESTIKMSGLDEFQWSLDDSKKMKGGSAIASASTTHPPMSIEATREMTRPAFSNPPPAPPSITVKKPIDDGGSNFLSMGVQSKQTEKKANNTGFIYPSLAPSSSPASSGSPQIEIPPLSTGPTGASATTLSRADMEEMVRRDLEAVLEKVARETLPQIAEAIIRKEIEKILSEP